MHGQAAQFQVRYVQVGLNGGQGTRNRGQGTRDGEAAATLIYELNVRLRFIAEVFKSTPCEIANNIKLVRSWENVKLQLNFN